MIFLLACTAPEPGPEGPGACELASEAVGDTVCVEEMSSALSWTALSEPVEVTNQVRSIKYLVPVDESQPVPTAFVNTQRYALHYDFLREAFPEDYGLLQWDDYVAMIIDPARRAYFGGNVTEYDVDGVTRYGFIVWDDPADETTAPTYDEVRFAWQSLQTHFGLGELAFVPSSPAQEDNLLDWDPAFTVFDDSEITYEAYNPGTAYGTVRFISLEELEAASDAGSFGWQDIVVLDAAPSDLARVVSGIVTGSRQAALSHLNVRASSRGSPNCFMAEPWTKLAAWEGELVRFSCEAEGYSVAAASEADAEAWWTEFRPDPVDIAAPDLDWTDPLGLLDVPTQSAAERDTAYLRFGAKSANLATLYQRIDSDYQLDGLVIPFADYDHFIKENTWSVGGDTLSFADTLALWHEDPEFLADAAVRSERLASLHAAMLAADVPTLPSIEAAIGEVFPATTMVRVRSSSNAEDGLAFSGAGLYDSASACLADASSGGDSACDNHKDARPLADAVRTVWASLWNAGAWEERAWYGVDQSRVAMALLVNTQSEDEEANIVAFTGNALADDTRWLVESQAGDLDVVSADPGVTPERVLLSMDGGEVAEIDRVADSSEVEEVLSDAQLEAVGALLFDVDSVMPYDGEPATGTFMWDTEQKVLADGRLIIKQVRPYQRE